MVEHHIYTGTRHFMEFTPRYADLCAEAVHDTGRLAVEFHQCNRKGTVKEVIKGKTYVFCKTHTLVEQEKRANKAERQYREREYNDRPRWTASTMADLLRAMVKTFNKDMVIGPNSLDAQAAKRIVDYLDGKTDKAPGPYKKVE
jgi:FtsZ-interacting cell division protein YlmF